MKESCSSGVILFPESSSPHAADQRSSDSLADAETLCARSVCKVDLIVLFTSLLLCLSVVVQMFDVRFHPLVLLVRLAGVDDADGVLSLCNEPGNRNNRYWKETEKQSSVTFPLTNEHM